METRKHHTGLKKALILCTAPGKSSYWLSASHSGKRLPRTWQPSAGAGGVSSPHPKSWGENPFFVELEFPCSMSRRSFERVLPNKRSWKIFPASVSETSHTLAYFLALVKSRDAPESIWPFAGSAGPRSHAPAPR